MMSSGRPNASRIDERILSRALSEQYGVEIQSLIRWKTVCGILAVDGQKYIWKAVDRPPPCVRLAAVAQLAAAVKSYGIEVAAPIANRMGDFVSLLDNGEYGYLQPWLCGRHLDITNRQERMSASATLAALHRVSADIGWPSMQAELHRGTLRGKMTLKRNFLLHVWDDVVRRFPPVERYQYLLFDAAESAIRAHSSPGAQTHVFCHRDLAPHNLLLQQDGRIAVIDFDQAGLDDPYIDLVQFANHGLYLSCAQPEYFQELKAAYQLNSPISPERGSQLSAFFRFPDVLIRALAEWVRADYATTHVARVLHALRVERSRLAIYKHHPS